MTRPVSLTLPVAALLAVIAPAVRAADDPGAPAPGRLRIFENWAVGCNNQLSCTAVALRPEDTDGAYSVLVRIQRAGGPEGDTELDLISARPLSNQLVLYVDGMEVAQLGTARDGARAQGAPALRLARLLGSSYAFELRQGQSALDAPSLDGLAMALRYIDEQQGRIGSEAALAAIGDRPPDLARAVPPPPGIGALPGLPAPVAPPGLDSAERAAARRLAACAGRMRADPPIQPHGLDQSHALVLLPCAGGGENASAVPLIATGRPGARTFQIARFDFMPGATGAPGSPPLIVNAGWNGRRGELTSLTRGRPRGDCGTSEIYRWDGAMFRLVEARAMPVCRGAWVWPVLWTASPGTAAALAP